MFLSMMYFRDLLKEIPLVDRHSPTPDALGYVVCALVYRAMSLALALETDRALRTAVLSTQ